MRVGALQLPVVPHSAGLRINGLVVLVTQGTKGEV